MTQAPANPAPQAGTPQPSKRRATSNIYTVMAAVALISLGTAIGYVMYRSAELFGSVGELFNLPGR